MNDIVNGSSETNLENITNKKPLKYPRRKRRERKHKINGVYQIINKINGNFYIGSSTNVIDRWFSHKARLKVNKHKNPHLQYAVNKYGIENFEFLLLEQFSSLDPMLSLNVEQNLLDRWVGNKQCYNINEKADKVFGIYHPMYGKHHTPEAKEKLRRFRTGRYLPHQHPMFNPIVYSFKNTETNEMFNGTYYNFCRKYGLHLGNVSRLIRCDPKIKSVKKWILL